jgi:hypothetical protein
MFVQMKLDELRKNIGRTFQFLPQPRRDDATGSWESDMNLWILKAETDDKTGFRFLNAIRDQEPFVLERAQIRQFDAPNNLILRGQVILRGTSVIFEPFYPKPASSSVPKTNLRLLIEGTDDTGWVVIPHQALEPLKFIVVNDGEITVRDYRNTVFIPMAFIRTSSSSYLTNLSSDSQQTIGEQDYRVYTNFISAPIYKEERARIGLLPLKADPGEYTFLWQIRCDNGVFPTETTYGEIKIRVLSLGVMMKDALENLHNTPYSPG